MNRDNAASLGIGLLAGGVVGAAIALLYAPQSGKETRQQLGDKASEVVEKVKARVEEIRSNCTAEEEI